MRFPARCAVPAALCALTVSLFAAAPVARADTHDATTVTLGWQTENADAVVLATLTAVTADGPADRRGADFSVLRSIKGAASVGSAVRVAYDDHGCGVPWRDGAQHLLFLRRLPGPAPAAPVYAPVCGAFSVRPLPEGSAEARFPELVATLEQTLESGEPGALGALLVTWMEDADPGVAWSAATDFVRHADVQSSLSEDQQSRIVAAYARQPIGKNTKGALALAVAATHSPAAVEVLVASLAAAGSPRIRASVAEALRRMDLPSAEVLVGARLKSATTEQRVAYLGVLAVIGGSLSVPQVRPLLDATDESIRIEAAAALGGMARNARAKYPEARLGLAQVLGAGLPAATVDTVSDNEMYARLWALAQLDEPKAFETLRTAVATTQRPDVRDLAARLLARPRQSLILK